MNKSVAILAAGSISHKFTSLRPQFSSAGLFPVNSKCLLSHVLDFYCKQEEITVFVVANSADERLLKTELAHYAFTFIQVDNTKNILETLDIFLKKAQGLSEDITISVVTTIPTEMPPPDSMLLSNRQELCHFYSAVADSENGDAKFFHRGSGSGYFGFPFTGVLRTRLDFLLSALARCTSDDLLEVAENIYRDGNLSFKLTEWIDCGHEVNYAEARAKLLSSRSFNSLSVEMISGILEKKSANIEKFTHETKYVESLPPELKVFFPRVIETLKIDQQQASVKMDYFSYPNISELQLYRNIEEVQWHRIFDAFDFVLRKFLSHPGIFNLTDYTDFYIGKTLNRESENEKWINNNQLQYFLKDGISINNIICKSFKTLLPRIEEKIRGLFNKNDFCVMHGDFCFNNILYDSYSGTIRLIDPRGSFGDGLPGIYGDIKYDLAKLLHSSVYGYDYIVNDLFQYEENNNNISYSFNLRQTHNLLSELSFNLIRKLGLDPDNIKILVGLLFVSMCPLHRDSLHRQKLMYAHGLYLLNKTLTTK
jgi:hypothetical protein